jgi:hypothetical protein
MLPNARLLAKASAPTSALSRSLTYAKLKWTDNWDRSKDKHVTRTTDSNNVQIDASRAGVEARAKGDVDCATSEKDLGQWNKKAEKEHPEAPKPVVGMNSERGNVGLSCLECFAISLLTQIERLRVVDTKGHFLSFIARHWDICIHIKHAIHSLKPKSSQNAIFSASCPAQRQIALP